MGHSATLPHHIEGTEVTCLCRTMDRTMSFSAWVSHTHKFLLYMYVMLNFLHPEPNFFQKEDNTYTSSLQFSCPNLTSWRNPLWKHVYRGNQIFRTESCLEVFCNIRDDEDCEMLMWSSLGWIGLVVVWLYWDVWCTVYIFSSCFSTMILSCSVFSFQNHVVINAFRYHLQVHKLQNNSIVP